MNHAKSNTARRGVVGVACRNGRLLVIRRSADVVAPGAFCFPGGAIEPGETEEEAVIRELREELAVRVRPQRRLWRSVTPWGVSLSWWLVELSEQDQPAPNPREVASVHWWTSTQMVAESHLLESNQHFLAALASGEIRLSIDDDGPT